MERLIVKNFGPLKDVDIELKDVNLFIGPTGSGKSTIAKLVAIFNHSTFGLSEKIDDFKNQLNNYEINLYLKENESVIEYRINEYIWKYKNDKIETNYPFPGVNIRAFLLSPIFFSFQNHEINPVNISPFNINEMLIELNKIKVEFVDSYDVKMTINRVIEDLTYYRNKFEEVSPNKNVYIQVLQKDSELLLHNISVIRSYITNIAIDAEAILIPAERMFYSTFNSALKSIILQELPIPTFLNLFGRAFDFALNMNAGIFETKDLKLKIAKNEGGLTFADSDNNITLPLQMAASGIQTMAPAAVVVGYWKETPKKKNRNIIIEEPELNLFPSTQYDFLKFILKDYKNSQLKTLITTHSPYVLSALDNLILADNISRDEKSNAETLEKIKSIIPEHYWVNYDDVAAYYCTNGEVKPILDKDRKGIDGNEIDSVSEKIGKEFDELTTLRYAEK